MRAPTTAACLIALILTGGVACAKDKSSSAKAPPAQKTRLLLATNSEPDTLNPLFAEMAVSSSVLLLGQRELTVYNDKWELVPDLAENVPSLDNGLVKLIDVIGAGEDGAPEQKMEVTWRIKKSAMWQDGKPVTAHDFVFAWQVQMDETQEIIDRDLPERIEKMEVRGDDDKTLVVTWKEPYAFFADYRVHRALPAHVLRSRYVGPDGNTRDLKRDPYGQAPWSNGPFKFKAWVPGQYITYERNERYLPRPHLDEVTIRIIPNNVALESALVAGDIDGVLAASGLTLAEVEGLKARHPDRFAYHTVPGLVWAHLDFNLDSPLLQDVRVRKAIAHAIDRRALIDELFYGKYTLAHTFLPPRHWGYKEDVAPLAYDLDKAKALLDEAGFEERVPGEARRDKRGAPLKLSISAVAGIKDIEQLEQVVQSDLKKAGIELVIDNKPAKVFFGELARYRKFPHLSFYSWVMSPSSWGNTLWQSDMIPSAQNQYKGQNYPGWRDDEVTQILKRVPEVLDEVERKRMMGRVQERFAEDLPALPVYFRPVVAVTREDLVGYLPTGTLTPVSWNAHEWRFESPAP